MPNADEVSVISGVVRSHEDEPVSEARVYFTDGPVPLPEIAALTNGKGEYSLSAPASGTYKVSCTADGFASLTREANVSAGANVEIDFKFES